jgi:hypothetical protein
LELQEFEYCCSKSVRKSEWRTALISLQVSEIQNVEADFQSKDLKHQRGELKLQSGEFLYLMIETEDPAEGKNLKK